MPQRPTPDSQRLPEPLTKYPSPVEPSIWAKQSSVEQLNEICKGTIHDPLGIEFTKIESRSLSGRMPVDRRTKQPFGVLHGGASVVLAESLGSMASYLLLPDGKAGALGIEINANHVKAVRSGWVHGEATPIHVGQTLHVWEIKLTDESGALVCICRLTVIVREPKAQPT